MSELFDAIRESDTDRARSLVRSDPALAASRDGNVSAILFALYNGQTDLALFFAESARAVDFHEACALGDLQRVRAMLAADPTLLDRRSADGFPPVGLAIFFRHPDVARFLIESGADVRAAAENDMRVAPVHAAAAVCDRESMRLLLARGADPNARQQGDVTPLHGAASRGDIEMAKLLLSHGARPDAVTSDGASVAGIAAKYKQTAFEQWLASPASQSRDS